MFGDRRTWIDRPAAVQGDKVAVWGKLCKISPTAAVQGNTPVTERKAMDKQILEQYSDAMARVRLLRESIERLEIKLEKMNQQGYHVTDSVNCGKKGKKTLGCVKVSGFPYPAYEEAKSTLQKRKNRLQQEEQELLELSAGVEEYIGSISNIEMRNILTLYYIDNLSWLQVARRMNAMYKRRNYTDGSCRLKHDRFLKK